MSAEYTRKSLAAEIREQELEEIQKQTEAQQKMAGMIAKIGESTEEHTKKEIAIDKAKLAAAKGKDFAKRRGRGLWGAAKWGGSKIGMGIGWFAGKPGAARASGDAINNLYLAPGFFFTFALGFLIFIFDMMRSFTRADGLSMAFFGLYALLGLIVFLQLNGLTGPGASGANAAFVIKKIMFAWGVPYLLFWLLSGAGQVGESALFQSYTDFIPSVWVSHFLTIVTGVYFPLFVLYIGGFAHYLLDQAGKRWRLWSFVNFAVLLLILLAFLAPVIQAVGDWEEITGITPSEYRAPTMAEMVGAVKGLFVGLFHAIYDPIVTGVEETIDSFTQPYFSGTVESSQGLPVGVTFRSVHPTYPYYTYDAYVDANGTITSIVVPGTAEDSIASTPTIIEYAGEISALTFHGSFPVSLSCYYELIRPNVEEPQRTEGTIGPVTSYTIQASGTMPDYYGWWCSIDMEAIPHQNTSDLMGRFYIQADFSFDTWGYTTWTFWDRDTMNSLMAQGIDPAQFLGIRRYAAAYYTPGPVSLGIERQSVPIGISQGGDNFIPPFGITIENKGYSAGEVRRINYVVLQVPSPLSLDGGSCIGTGGASSSNQGAGQTSAGGFTVPSGYGYTTIQGIEYPRGARYQTIMCPMNANAGGLVGPALTAQSFTLVARVNYDYEMRRYVPVMIKINRIQEATDTGTTSTSTTASTTGDTTTVGPSVTVTDTSGTTTTGTGGTQPP